MNITQEHKIERAVMRAMETHGAPALEQVAGRGEFRAKFTQPDILLDFTEVPSLLSWLKRYLQLLAVVARNEASAKDEDANAVLLQMHNVVLATLLGVDTDCVYERPDLYGLNVQKDGFVYTLEAADYCIYGATRHSHPLEELGKPFIKSVLHLEYEMSDVELLANEFFNQRDSILSITFSLGKATAPKFKFKKKDFELMDRLLAEIKMGLLSEWQDPQIVTDYLKSLASLIIRTAA